MSAADASAIRFVIAPGRAAIGPTPHCRWSVRKRFVASHAKVDAPLPDTPQTRCRSDHSINERPSNPGDVHRLTADAARGSAALLKLQNPAVPGA